MDGVRRGDRGAIAAVYLEVAPALRGYLLRRIGHGEVADDLVEQVFVALITSGERIRGDGRSLRAWLYRAARNDLLDWRKRAERRSDHELTAHRQEALHSSEPGPDEQAIAAVGDPLLLRALEALTEEQREVLELRYVAGLSLEQTAELVGRTVGAVKSLQHRGVRRLAVLLEQEDPATP
jgi:RNA polymerase sigma-70 factor, ECF subfamily